MNAPNAERLGDKPLEEATRVPAETAIREVAAHGMGDRWIVIVDEMNKPLAAVRSEALPENPEGRPISSILADLPPMILAPADSRVDELLPLAAELTPGSVVIVEDDDNLRIWSDPHLDPLRGSDAHLPGPYPRVPLLLKVCRYGGVFRHCGHPQRFVVKPQPMPDCPDPKNLGPHPFRW
ncbi:hypothetical protein E6W39_02475 [Kitasatospora acidiphila]|uniref:CBS domain-containing protein n=1 Tax=Kitasatospora acidiphila TaxID=2567942 RepID=A0A540VX23_9ACTN|nr:hypothetical protein [Kitasatospora acidiphila]TQF01309.1 hypothetical protein E6W39_02475 [Kitasatospora acidiphila]